MEYRFSEGSKGRKLEDYLLRGNIVTNAMSLQFGIAGSSLPKYIQMLKEKYHVTDKWVQKNGNDYKEYKIKKEEPKTFTQSSLFNTAA